MTTEVLRLGMNTTGFEAGGRRARTTLQRIKKEGLSTGKVLTGLAGTIAITLAANAVGAGIRSFIQFDAAMSSSLAIMGDVSEAMRQDMAEAARQVSEDVNFAAKDTAEAYYFLASAGMDAAQSVAALPAVANFARAGMFDLSTATDLATDAQSALGLASKDVQVNLQNLTRVTDVLVKANTLANASVEQFSTALTSEAGAALKTFGKDAEEGVAVLAAFADQGVKAQVAGTGLSRILRLMSSAAVNNAAAYKELEVEVFNATGNMRNLADIIEDLEQATATMSDETRVAALEQLGFQARVQGVILPLLGASEKIREYEAALREAGGTTAEVAGKQMLSIENRIGQIKQRFSNWRDEIVERTVPAIELLLDHSDKLADALKAAGIVLGATAGAGLIAAFVTLGPSVWGAVTAFAAMVPLVNSAAAAWNLLTISMWPIAGALAAITGAVYLLIRAKRKEREEIEETARVAREAAENRLTLVQSLTKEELELADARLWAEKLAITAELGSHITDDEADRVVRLQEIDKLLEAIAGRMEEVNRIDPPEPGDPVLSAWEKFLEILTEIREEAEALKRQNLKDILTGKNIQMVDSINEADGPAGYDLGEMTPQLKAYNRELEENEHWLREVTGAMIEHSDVIVSSVRGIASLTEALGVLNEDASDAVRGLVNVAEGLQGLKRAQGLEGAAGMAATIGGIAGIAGGAIGLISGIAGLFGGDDDARQQKELERLDRERKATEQFAEAVQQFESAVYGTPSSLSAAYESLLTDLEKLGNRYAKPRTPDPIDKEKERLRLLDEYEEKLAALNASFREELDLRLLIAQGKDVDAERMRLEIEQRKELEEATAAGWSEELMELLREVQEAEWDKAAEAWAEMGDAVKVATDEQVAAMKESLELRGLVALGLDDEARALQNQIELERLRTQGFDESIIAMAAEVQALEERAIATREAEEAGKKFASAMRERFSFLANLSEREAALAGDDRGALAARLVGRGFSEIERAKELLEAGTITKEMFERLTWVIGEETDQALRDFDQAARDAAEAAREAAAAERLKQATDLENLRVRLFVAQGKDEEARALRNELELIKAIRAGRGGEYIALLQQVQAAEAATNATVAQNRALEETAEAAERVSSALNAPQGLRLSLHRWRSSIVSGPTAPSFGAPAASSVSGTAGAPVAINVSVAGSGGNESDEELATRLARLIQQKLRAGAPHLFNDVVG